MSDHPKDYDLLKATIELSASSLPIETKLGKILQCIKGIIGMRNRMVHEYFRISPGKVWDVVQGEIQSLIPLLEPLVPSEGKDEGS